MIGSQVIQTRIAMVLFTFLMINYCLFSLLLVFNPELYARLSLEDNFAEYVGALFLLICGTILVLSSRQCLAGSASRYLTAIIGVLFILASGEEISWGQRIFSWDTPQFLMEVNDQNETNIHNINKKFFDRLYDRGIFLLWLVTCVSLWMKKDSIFGVKLPSILLLFCFTSISYYREMDKVADLDLHYIPYIVSLLIYIGLNLRSGTKVMLFSSIMLFITMISMVFWNVYFYENFTASDNSANEIREYLFAACSLAYACEIYGYSKSLKISET
jgi:hypothetical protein